MLSLALQLIGLARSLLKYLASFNSADAVRAQIVLQAMEMQDKRIQDALKTRDDALAELLTTGASDDTHFRD